jgi:hypothetical protein
VEHFTRTVTRLDRRHDLHTAVLDMLDRQRRLTAGMDREAELEDRNARRSKHTRDQPVGRRSLYLVRPTASLTKLQRRTESALSAACLA